MGLKYIFGGPGSGKTMTCFDEIYNLCDKTDRPLIYIVPEQFSLLAEKRLAERFEGKAVIKGQVLSFNRLAYNIFSENGTGAMAVLDRTGKIMLIRRAFSNVANKLLYYKNVKITNGFIDNISQTITEFSQYNVDTKAVSTVGENTALNFKLRDLSLIIEEYERLSVSYLSADDTLNKLIERIDTSEFLRGAHVWIDNFYGFTIQEYKVIEGLFMGAESVNICVNIDNGLVHYDDISELDPFYEIKSMVNRLTDIAKKAGIKTHEHIQLKKNARYGEALEIKYLTDNYNKYIRAPFTGENNRIKLSLFKNKYEEVEAGAALIHHMVRERGYRYADIGILTGDLLSYDNDVTSAFARYNIPVFVDKRLDLVNHPLTEYIRSLIRIVVDNWSYDSVFNLLKTGLTPFEPTDIDILENYCIAYGIRGDMWKNLKYWSYGFGDKGRFNQGQILAVREKVYDYIYFFTGKYRRSEKYKTNKICLDIYRYLMDMDIPRKIEKMCTYAMDNSEMGLYRRHFSIWLNVMGVFEKLNDIFGEESFKFDQFAEIIESGLGCADMGIIPPSQDQVSLGDLYRSRFDEIKVLLILGATSEAFPKIERDVKLLDDNERATLKNAGITLGPSNVRKTGINSYLVYAAMVKASDYLYIFCPETDGVNSLRVSPVFDRIEKMFNNAYLDKAFLDDYISTEEAMFRRVVKAVYEARGENIESLKDYALRLWYAKKQGYNGILESVVSTDYYGNERLSECSVDMIYGENTKTSVSRLERFVECPFSFYVKYGLEAEKRQSYHIQRVDLGNLFHEILEIFARIVRAKNLSWGRLSYEQINEMVDLAYVQINETRKSDLFINEARSRFILERTKKIAKTSI
ncbi:MAG: PD-(D/E)XK nuclease family protein, partial [Clostridiales bacterium]|nr:PD-(D/E)XK nuclease family protein [Clostridiales bacterium]